jgi:hypothetical protein
MVISIQTKFGEAFAFKAIEQTVLIWSTATKGP